MLKIDGIMRGIARWLAYAGGAVLLSIVILTCISIIGRRIDALGHGAFLTENLPFLAAALQWFAPVEGIYDLTEMGTAFAIMAFLPWCQINRAHAKVDIITTALPAGGNKILAFLWEILFAFVITVIAWRLFEGMASKYAYGETLFLLKVPFSGEPVPIWWGYAACFFAACIATIISWWSAAVHGLELLGNAPGLEDGA